MSKDPFSELRTLLAEEPRSSTTFERILALVDEAYDSCDAFDALVEYAEQHLADWTIVCRQASGKAAPRRPSFGLVRSFYVDCSLEELEELLRTPLLSRIESLQLHGDDLTDKSAKALAGAAHLSHLGHLSLPGSRIGIRGLRALCHNSKLTDLKLLGLVDGGLRGRAIEVLAETTSLTQLRALDLEGNHLTDRDLDPLFRDNQLGQLEYLNLKRTRVSESTAYRLKKSKSMPALQEVGWGDLPW